MNAYRCDEYNAGRRFSAESANEAAQRVAAKLARDIRPRAYPYTLRANGWNETAHFGGDRPRWYYEGTCVLPSERNSGNSHAVVGTIYFTIEGAA